MIKTYDREMQIFLKLYYFTGYHPECSYWFKKVALILGIIVYGTPLSLAIKGVVEYYHKSDMLFVSQCLQTIFLTYDPLCRHIILHRNVKHIETALILKKKSWKIEDLTPGTYFYLAFAKRTIIYYYFGAFLLFSYFGIQPFVTGKLPVATYVPDGYFTFLSVFYMLVGSFIYVTSMVTDSLFCLFCAFGIVQFKELKNRLRNLQPKNMMDEIKECVDHHNLLLRFCQSINKMYSEIFIVFYGAAIGAACVQIYTFMNDDIATPIRLKGLMYFVVQLIQISLYCIGADVLSHSADEIASAAYESKWYETGSVQYRKALVMIIQRGQEKVLMSGHGLFYINITAYVVILKTALSFYTYLNSFKDDK